MPLDSPEMREETELLARYGQGDLAAGRALLTRFTPRIVAYAMRMLGGDRAEAEDVAQEAMLRLWRAAPGWREGQAQVSTWLYRVVANLVTDRLRQRGRRQAHLGGPVLDIDEASNCAGSLPDGEAVLLAQERMSILDQALAALPERQREAVILRHIEGLTNPEIGAIMGIGVEAVESLTARGKRALSTLLQNQRKALGHDGD